MSYCFVLVALLTVSTAQADIIFVDVNCPGPGNGSVRDPYCSIQTAIGRHPRPIMLTQA